jgi:hypothetical protein
MPPECTPVDPAVVAPDFSLCACDSFTYEECGKYCKETVPAQLLANPSAVGAQAVPPFMCTPPAMPPMPPPPLPEPVSALAKDVCSTGLGMAPPPPP